MPSFKKEIQLAKTWYDKWRKRKTYSPALKSNVRISLKAWNHLVGNQGHKKRSFKDKYRRMKLLKYAEQIITTSTTVQNITVKHGIKYYALEAMIEVNISKNQKEFRKVRVIIYEDKKGDKIFYSVMDKRQK